MWEFPQQFRTFLDTDASHHFVLDDEGSADMAEQFVGLSASGGSSLQRVGERFDGIEDGGDAGFAFGEGNASGHDIGDDLEAFDIEFFHPDDAIDGLFAGILVDADFGAFVFGVVAWERDERGEVFEEGGFFDGGEIEEDGDAVSEQDGGALVTGADGER